MMTTIHVTLRDKIIFIARSLSLEEWAVVYDSSIDNKKA